MMGLNRCGPSAQLGWHSTELSIPVPTAPPGPHDSHLMFSITEVESQL